MTLTTKHPSTGICHECGKQFELKIIYLIPNHDEIWECPHCGYPNSKGDCIA